MTDFDAERLEAIRRDRERELSFEILQREPKTGEVKWREQGLSLYGMLHELENVVDDKDVWALSNFVVRLEGDDENQPFNSGDVWGMRGDVNGLIELFTGRRPPGLKRVTPDLVVSELIRDQMDFHPAKTMPGQYCALAMQENVRSAIRVIEALGFVIAKETPSNG